MAGLRRLCNFATSFHSDRPFASGDGRAAPPPPPPAGPDLDGLVLVGTLTDAEGKSIAIIRDDNIGETVYVREGDDLNGSIVELISDNSVVVVLDDETDELLGASYEF